MHDNDDGPRVIRLVRPGQPQEDAAGDFWGYDEGREAGWRAGYHQAIRDVDRDAERMKLIVTWGLIGAFAIGGVFGVGVCAHLWPLIEAGVLP